VTPSSVGGRRAARAARLLAAYAGGGSLAGTLGFGILWRGLAARAPLDILAGLGLLALGLTFAGVALAAGMLAARGPGSAAGCPADGFRGTAAPAAPGAGPAPACGTAGASPHPDVRTGELPPP
jgi:hypothetical protein